ncbi:MAG TPA: SDR family oxidoreductase [Candidatus Omnitrophota bacterium]|nr:SDR family oxidoreductase [Candidatus Omnitrophota bacterium]HRY85185.1 SDR family oxidoreductase [Candidatus Omnitrophota bacterium]
MVHTIVVGGTRGLGREVAKTLGIAGHRISVLGRKEPPQKDGNILGAQYYQCDLADERSLKKKLDSLVKTQGKPSYIVFCQRYRGQGSDWQGELGVTLTATKTIIETLENKFTRSGDKGIVMVSSVFAERVGDGQPVGYHVCKAGLNQMMRFFAVKLGPKGIRVNAVTPFTFLKEESKEFYLKNKPLHDLYRRMIPLGRMATSEDSAKAVAFLCSSQASFISGQNLYIDGGLSLVWPETLARKIAAL